MCTCSGDTRRRLGVAAVALLVTGALAPRAGAQLAARVELHQEGSLFAYTLFNDEPPGSPNFLTTFHLAIAAPIATPTAPPGWAWVTDGSTYIDWFNTDPDVPYPNDVAPGSSLSGFEIRSAGRAQPMSYAVSSWDHPSDGSGSSAEGSTSGPFLNHVPSCFADFNRNGVVDSQDFIDFLNAFFMAPDTADFNNDGAVNSQDFFDFLAAFFSPC